MRESKALRQQVVTEIKLRRYFWNTLFSIALVYILGSIFFGDMGVMRYMELSRRKASIEQELNTLKSENKKTALTLYTMDTDNFYIEKNARESFGMAGKDEYIFIYKD